MDSSKQKKPKEVKTENNNKSKIQDKKKEEPKKCIKINTSNKNNINNDRLHTTENEHRKKSIDFTGNKVKESGKDDDKVRAEGKKKISNKKIDNDDEKILSHSMSFKISFNKKKQNSKKEEKPKENKNTKINKKPLIKKKDKAVNNINQESEAIFNYNGVETTIQIHSNDKMKDIINKYVQKTGNKRDNFIFMYNGVQIDENLSFTEQVNDDDNNRKKINIIVADIDFDNKEEPKQSEVISNYFICPECYENIVLNIKNYKIDYKCKNKHIKNQMMLNEYEKLQKIDLTKIKCGQCEKCTKRDTFNNTFFYCYDCKKSICPLCKNSHDPKHKLFNYDDKNYYCEKHNEQFIEYCQKCEKNLCFLCKNEHATHENIINLQDMMIPKEELLIHSKIAEYLIFEIRETVKIITNKLNYFSENLDMLYKINKN